MLPTKGTPRQLGRCSRGEDDDGDEGSSREHSVEGSDEEELAQDSVDVPRGPLGKSGADVVSPLVHGEGSCGLLPHQEFVSKLLCPSVSVTRSIINYPIGSGKTRIMIQVLDNYFLDPRAKLAIFPVSGVAKNFYLEVLRWPNRYRD